MCLVCRCGSCSCKTHNFLCLRLRTRRGLSRNVITKLEVGAFEGLTDVRALYLDQNLITSIEFGTFDGMPQLNYLLLDNNEITSIGPSSFSPLSALSILTLNDNQLSQIVGNMFGGLPGTFSELILENNQIARIEKESLNPTLNTITFL